jgi:hypothetical protein
VDQQNVSRCHMSDSAWPLVRWPWPSSTVCSKTQKRTACLVDRARDAFAFFVAVQDWQLTAHDRPLVFYQFDAVLREFQPLIEAHAWVVGNLRCVLPEPVLPPLFVVARF